MRVVVAFAVMWCEGYDREWRASANGYARRLAIRGHMVCWIEPRMKGSVNGCSGAALCLARHVGETSVTEIIYPELSYAVQGAFFDVHNELRGYELSEEGWETALMIALDERNLPAVRQDEFELRYKGYRIGLFFVDVVVDDKLLIELKVADSLQPIDEAQVLTYLKVTETGNSGQFWSR